MLIEKPKEGEILEKKRIICFKQKIPHLTLYDIVEIRWLYRNENLIMEIYTLTPAGEIRINQMNFDEILYSEVYGRVEAKKITKKLKM